MSHCSPAAAATPRGGPSKIYSASLRPRTAGDVSATQSSRGPPATKERGRYSSFAATRPCSSTTTAITSNKTKGGYSTLSASRSHYSKLSYSSSGVSKARSADTTTDQEEAKKKKAVKKGSPTLARSSSSVAAEGKSDATELPEKAANVEAAHGLEGSTTKPPQSAVDSPSADGKPPPKPPRSASRGSPHATGAGASSPSPVPVNASSSSGSTKYAKRYVSIYKTAASASSSAGSKQPAASKHQPALTAAVRKESMLCFSLLIH